MKQEDKEELDCPFPIRTYTKAELAALYCPCDRLKSSQNNFWRWMQLNKKLMSELSSIGYYKYRHSFTPLEVSIIVKYMGEPG
ncbi:MAG: hypothetical protein H6Q13_3093 [Bacteroidetes bacterium]|nr:hypothetical protein [Bacteroidota bacterium]